MKERRCARRRGWDPPREECRRLKQCQRHVQRVRVGQEEIPDRIVVVEKRRHWRTATERGTARRRSEGMAGCKNDMMYGRLVEWQVQGRGQLFCRDFQSWMESAWDLPRVGLRRIGGSEMRNSPNCLAATTGQRPASITTTSPIFLASRIHNHGRYRRRC